MIAIGLRIALFATITLVLLEVALRSFDPLGLAYYADGKTYFLELITPREGFGYIHRANTSVKLRTMDVVTNGQGFRWTEFPDTAPDRRRVLILGDSVVFGWGVSVEQTFTAKLQRSRPSLEILAAGVASWNTRSEYEWLERKGLDYDLDAVVWVVTTNDVMPNAVPRQPPSMLRRHLSRPFVLSTARHFQQLARASRGVTAALQKDSPEWKDTEEALEAAVELCEKNGIELVVVMYGALDTEFDRSFHDGYRDVLNRNGVELLRFPDDVYAHRNSSVDAHPNDTGHELMAEWLDPLLEKDPS